MATDFGESASLRMLRRLPPPRPVRRTFEVAWTEVREPCALAAEHHWHHVGEVDLDDHVVSSTGWRRWCCYCGTAQVADSVADDEGPACGPFAQRIRQPTDVTSRLRPDEADR